MRQKMSDKEKTPSPFDSQSHKESEDDGSKKKKIIIITSVVVVILLVIAGFFLFKGKEEEPGKDDDPSTSQTADPSYQAPGDGEGEGDDPQTAPPSQSPKNNDGIIDDGKGFDLDENGNIKRSVNTDAPLYRDTYLPEKEEVDDPVDTEVNTEGLSQGELEDGVDYRDNKRAPVKGLAQLAAQSMMTPDMNDGGYEKSIEDILNKYGTKKAKKEGFRKWWTGQDHTPEFEIMSLNGDKIIAAAKVDPGNTEFYANNILKVRVNGTPRVMGGDGSTAVLNPIKMDLYMKKVNGAWYIDAYDFVDGYQPEIR